MVLLGMIRVIVFMILDCGFAQIGRRKWNQQLKLHENL